MNLLDPIADSIQQALSGVHVATAQVGQDYFLTDSERAAVGGMTKLRAAQFAGGRKAARTALAKFGVEGASLEPDHDGIPRWPPGIVGSISHKRHTCVAIVGRTSVAGSLGIDVELDDARDDAVLIREICTDSETKQLTKLQSVCCSPPSLILASKEAFYKAHFALWRRPIAWTEIDLTFDTGENGFSVGWQNQERVTGQGIFAARDGWLMAAYALR